MLNCGKLVHKISINRDRYSPFRELGPSLVFAYSANPGPFSPAQLRTRSGFFSALVLRALTFGAPIASVDGHVFFEDMDHWKTITNAAIARGVPDSYFCDPKVYGSYNRHRDPKIVEELWTQSAVWNKVLEKFDEDGNCSALDFYKIMAGKTEGIKFTNVNTLTGYLITADYISAGLVRQPTVEEMAEILVLINRGGLAGLRALGLLPLRKTNVVAAPDAAVALQKLWEYLKENCLDMVKDRLSLVLIEHALCKYSKLRITGDNDL